MHPDAKGVRTSKTEFTGDPGTGDAGFPQQSGQFNFPPIALISLLHFFQGSPALNQNPSTWRNASAAPALAKSLFISVPDIEILSLTPCPVSRIANRLNMGYPGRLSLKLRNKRC